ncbi:sentrin-specific protease 7 isoform X2 [Mugil cephalus]|uniref:sentrin-specific protease 7 isoform X2 n=1 Tax=Mugil cephalus TaxID=48193 RepID=UPI001FB57A27|nr:sentrin-specific protease 7 isoform X2 [Mugil cephalus]
MMAQRSALTIPFTVDKDKQVSWTTLTGCKTKLRNSQHKNGSMVSDHKRPTVVTWDVTKRMPLLILTDVLKTDLGKAYMERIKKSSTGCNGEQMSQRSESGWCRDEPLTCKDSRPSRRETRRASTKNVTPKSSQTTTPSSSQRSRLRKKLLNADDEGEKEDGKDIEEVVIGKDDGGGDRFAEVVDCGLSVSWEPNEDTAGCGEFTPTSIRDRWSEPEKELQQSSKRKYKDPETHCNGMSTPKRPRQSVLRLTGEEGTDVARAPPSICQEDAVEDLDLDSLDRCIVQFTVGEDNGTEVLLPVVRPRLDGEELSSNHDNTTQTNEAIVLSSDDEESGDVSQCSSRTVRALVTMEDAAVQDQSSQEDIVKHIQGMQVVQVVVEDPLPSPRRPSPVDPYVGVTFSTLYCGGYQGKAFGRIVIMEKNIIIPVKDPSEQSEVILSFERTELRRYSVWEQHELEAREIRFQDEDAPCPAAVLLLCVSETAAAAVQRDLSTLCVKEDGATNTGKASPFILLTLREPLEGMEGALLRSFLDLDCLNNVTHESDFVTDGTDCGLDLAAPVLSLADSIELIKRTGPNDQILSTLGLRSVSPALNVDEESSHADGDVPPTLLEDGSHKEPVPELEKASDVKLKEDQKEGEIEHPSDKVKGVKGGEPTPVYTLCHRRTKGSRSVSMCKPNSDWVKFKHQGLPHRLIQFPPPPLKGGITVTMEDLQCLDSGQYLNDVIIDFYLKYLLQNASASVAERSHIFSSFFYKQLTRRDNASEGTSSESCQRQRRHQRVKTWTRHVDIFKKDFLFVPVNQEAHWYLVVICFPGLMEPKVEDWTGPNAGRSQDKVQGCKRLNDNTRTAPVLNHRNSVDKETENTKEESNKDPPPGPVNCTELTCQNKAVCKMPSILIMDSLKLSLHERVFKLIRDYLQSEWEARRGSSRDFGPDQMKSSYCRVPLQDNSSDCGLYLLQYVECFLKDPVVHFDLPLNLQRWFPRQQVRRKRDEIRDLILNLYRHQKLDNKHSKQLCS